MANIDYLILAILLFIFLIVLIKKLIDGFTSRKTRKIDKLLRLYGDNPWEFEGFIADLYESKGYKTELTKGSGDRGKDIVMYKARHKYAVEVKLYAKDHKIDREKIQKLHSAMIDCDADKAIFVTTSDFTDPAYEYADKYGIETICGEDLIRLIKSTKIRVFH